MPKALRMGGGRLPPLLALLQVCSFSRCAAATQPLWLIGYMPFTAKDGGPLEGLAQREAVNIMLEQVNLNPSILPGRELKVVWQDDHCDADIAGNYILDNVFYQEYHVFAPGASLASLDVNGDDSVEYSETNPLKEIWNSSDVDPRPVGVIGASCSSVSEKLVDVCYAAKLPLVSGSATSLSLSDRTSYRNFFRTIIPDMDLSHAWLALVKYLGHTQVTAITGTSDDWATKAAIFAKATVAAGITMVGPSATGVDMFKGSRVSTMEQAAKATVQLLKTKVRIVILLLEAQAVRFVLCQSHQKQFLNAVWMSYKSIGLNFWDTAVDGCTTAEVKSMASGFLLTSMVYWREDDSQQLSCSTSMTAAQFATEWWSRVGQSPGNYGRNSMGFSPVDSAATWADAACMYAMALHQAISVRGLSVADLAARNTTTYNVMVDELNNTDFQGVQGRLLWDTQDQVEPHAAMLIQQLQGTNLDYVTLATYSGSALTLKGGNFMFGLGENIAATPGSTSASVALGQFRTCPSNAKLIFSTNLCEACPQPSTTYVETESEVDCLCSKGYYNDGGTCKACAAGNFSSSFGVSSCKTCEEGEFSATSGQSACELCPRGKYGNQAGMSICQQCPGNKDTLSSGNTNPSGCVCAANYFSSGASGACERCPTSATSAVGSTAVEDCHCPANHYMSADNTSCIQCPADSATAGTGKTRIGQCFCPQGSYMNINQCEPCPRGMICPKGSNAANTQVLGPQGKPPASRGPEEQFPGLLENHWSSKKDPFSVYQCRGKDRCPGECRSPGGCEGEDYWPGKACAGNLKDSDDDIACEHCIDEYYWTGSNCSPCNAAQSSIFLFPVLPILLTPFMITLFYKFFGDPLPRWGSWQNSTAALLFIILNHYQILGVLSQMSLELPDNLTDLLGFYSNTNDFSTSLSIECVSLRELVKSMIIKACFPIVLIWACLLSYFASHFLSHFLHKPMLAMEKNRLFNVFGSLMFTFFGAIAGMSLQLFKCSANPGSSGPTLASDRSVHCWTAGKWTSGLGVGIACVIVYIIGVGGLFCRAIYKAPVLFGDAGFQMRWKFLFIKFHSGAYWWGIMFLMKNFLVNLVPVVWTQQVARLYVSMSVILAYLSLVVLIKPYRAEVANYFEMLAAVCIMFVTSLLTWHADRLIGMYDGEERGQYDPQITLATILISFVPVGLLPCGVLYLRQYGKEIVPSPQSAERARKLFENLKDTYGSFVTLEVETGVFTLLHLGDAELRTLEDAAFLINTDILGKPSRYRIASRSIYQNNRLPADAVSV